MVFLKDIAVDMPDVVRVLQPVARFEPEDTPQLSDCIRTIKSDNSDYVKSAKVGDQTALTPCGGSVSYKPVPADLSDVPPMPPALREALSAKLNELLTEIFHDFFRDLGATAVCASADENGGGFFSGGCVNSVRDFSSNREGFGVPFTGHEFVLPAVS